MGTAARAHIHLALAAAGLFPPALPPTPIASPPEKNFNSTFKAEKPDVMFAIKKYKLWFEGHLLQYSPE